MSQPLSAALAYLKEHQGRFIDELKQFIAFPSISTDPTAKPHIEQAAQWVADHLRQLGCTAVEIFATPGQPIVYGELSAGEPGKPTVLIYGHYDVQPAEPLELWESPPFEATQRGENLYGRGASDMKGQVMITFKAVEALKHSGGLKVNLKFLIEGEEEIGSPNLASFLAAHQDLLRSDFALNPDTGMLGPEIPTITYGLRGLAYFELRLYGPSHDLHSGGYGGVVHNPAQVLCELIAAMHDAEGRVTLPGFYDKVRPLSAEERAEMARLPTDEDFYLRTSGAPALYGEVGYTPAERVGARPTLEVNGLLAGYTGEGSKTVLPAKAMAKLSTRLVPDQDPEEVHQQLRRFLESHAPPTVRWELIPLAGGKPFLTSLDKPAVKILGRALQETWGVPPMYHREGGSVPVAEQLSTILGIDSVLTGFGLPDDRVHSPNEKLHLPTFFRGMEAIARFLYALGQVENAP